MEHIRYLFKFYYIASVKYYGSQRQTEHNTIEDCLISAFIDTNYIKNVSDSKFEVASRTDRFVSALGSAFSVISSKPPILMEINSALPPEIGLWAYTSVPNDFISRFNAVYRHYKYVLPISEHIKYRGKALNLKLMKKACRQFEGRHDFHNFYKRGKEEVKTSREIIQATLKKEGQFLIFDFKSQAFLRQQIRRMISKILELGLHEIDYNQFLDLFNPDVDISYEPADSRGLLLWDINYGDSVRFTIDSKSIQRRDKFFSEQEFKEKLKYKLFSIMQHNDVC